MNIFQKEVASFWRSIKVPLHILCLSQIWYKFHWNFMALSMSSMCDRSKSTLNQYIAITVTTLIVLFWEHYKSPHRQHALLRVYYNYQSFLLIERFTFGYILMLCRFKSHFPPWISVTLHTQVMRTKLWFIIISTKRLTRFVTKY